MSSRLDRNDAGTALVESAFVLPILVVVLFGIFELGFLFDTATISSSSSRSGARLASATYGFANSPGERDAVLDQVRLSVEEELEQLSSTATPVSLWIFRAGPHGHPDGASDFESCASNCVQMAWNGSNFSVDTGSWPSPDACGETRDRIGIRVAIQHEPVAGAFGWTWNVDEYTAMRLEPRTDC